MNTVEESTSQLIQKGKFTEALELLDAAIAEAESSGLWNDWATVQFKLGHMDQSERGYRRALELDYSDRQAAVNLGLLLFAHGRLQEAMPLLEQHGETLTLQEKQAINNLVVRFRGSLAPQRNESAHDGIETPALVEVADSELQGSQLASQSAGSVLNHPKLSLVMPSHRAGLDTCARILDACSCADKEVEIIVRDNSGDDQKREILSKISRDNCRIVIVDPCGARENNLEVIGLANGEFVFYIADDDVLPRASIRSVVERVTQRCEDMSVVGVTGDYIIENSRSTHLFRYPPLDTTTASQRVGDYLKDIGANAINYSAIRCSAVCEVMSLCRAMPFTFSYVDQLISLMYLSLGRFVTTNRVIYNYNCFNWDTPERALQSDLLYIRRNGLDGSTLRMMWLICGLEGARIILGKLKGLKLSQSERGAVATLWWQRMSARFAVTISRTDPSSRFDREALALCNKWKQIHEVHLELLLADISEFMALSDREIGERYFEFWKS